MTSSRQTILDFLENKHASTPLEIAQALHMTPANVRHHLSILIAEGVVEVIGERAAGQRGRPARLYTLSSFTHRHNLDGLANALIDALLCNRSSTEQQVILRSIANTLAGLNGPSSNLSQRFFQAIRRLNEMRYDAHWEAHAKAPHLIFRHCPYMQILPAHPVLCQIDVLLLEALLNKPARLVEKLAQDTLGATYCKFIIEE